MEAVCEFDRIFSRNVPHISEMMFLSLDLMSFMNCLEVCKSWYDLLLSKPFNTSSQKLCIDFEKKLLEKITFTVEGGK